MIDSIMKTNPIQDAIRAAGSGPKLAQQLGISARAIYKWAARWDDGIQAAVPAHRAIEIEAATGIPRSHLRPDLWGETPRTAA
jgi:DNA-binding transcriptional regulator YdaS (Cro superfamily)